MSFTFSTIVPASLAETFAWHARPGAFTRLAPPWMPARIIAEAASLRDGRAVLGFPGGLKWIAQHDPAGFAENQRFADELIRDGLTSWPISAALNWRHTHEFESLDDARTQIRDTVETNAPSGMLSRMFTYRSSQLTADFEAHQWARAEGAGKMTVALTGSSGLIGSALEAFLTTGGHRVIRLVRGNPRGPDERRWDQKNPDPMLLHGVDALIHLAGAPIAGRFTESHKRAVRDSRVPATRKLAELIARTPQGPKVFLCASAIGFYGADRGEEELTEASAPGEGFLADVVVDWEAATAPARAAGARVVNVRTGIVQAASGGMLGLVRPLFAAGLGGRIGDGKQWMAWIGLDDLVYIYHRALIDPRISGPINATAPEPVRNAEYTRALAKALRRPAVIPVPSAGPKLLLGSEGAKEVAMANQRVVPAALIEAGFPFRRPSLGQALRHELGRERPSPR